VSGRRTRRGPEHLISPRGDVTSTMVLNVVGIVLIVVACIGASGQAKVGAAFPYINLGVAGVLVVAVGNTVYLQGFRRAVRNRSAAYRQSSAGGRAAP
jgi:fatty acid desaturase